MISIQAIQMLPRHNDIVETHAYKGPGVLIYPPTLVHFSHIFTYIHSQTACRNDINSRARFVPSGETGA